MSDIVKSQIYFVFTDAVSYESEALKEAQPPNLLLSYWYFKNKGIQHAIDKIGYTPANIMLDSGAWSAWNKGKNIAVIDYISFVKEHSKLIQAHIALDVIEDDEVTKRYYQIMEYKGLEPIPVFHKGDNEKYLKYYISSRKGKLIALGGTAAERSKDKVREWVQQIHVQYPEQSFHLLGSSSGQVIPYCNLSSYDSSTWIMQALNGYPQSIPGRSQEARKQRAVYWIKKLIKEAEGLSSEPYCIYQQLLLPI